MAAGPVRDDDALAAGLERWLEQEDGAAGALRGAHMDALRRPSSGSTNETVMVDLTLARSAPVTVVVRMPPLVSSFPDQDVAFEAAVLGALGSTPVPVPAVIATELDEQSVGAPFAVMAFVDGHVVGDVPAFDQWLGALGADEQRARHEAFVTMLATLHRCDVDAVPLAHPTARRHRGRARVLGSAASRGRRMGPRPRRLTDTLRVVPRRTRARAGGPVAAVGDPRLGNVIWSDAPSESPARSPR